MPREIAARGFLIRLWNLIQTQLSMSNYQDDSWRLLLVITLCRVEGLGLRVEGLG